MDDILDYNPEIIYHKIGENDWKTALKKLRWLFVALLIIGFYGYQFGTLYFEIVPRRPSNPGSDFYLLAAGLGLFSLGICSFLLWKMVEILIKKLWVVYGEESLSLLPSSLSLRRRLVYDFERVIPFGEIREIRWLEHGVRKKWNQGNFPFHFGKVVVLLKDGKELHIGTDITLEEFRRLDGNI